MKRSTAALAAGALVGASVIGYDLAGYAATGQSLILGRDNTAGATTTLTITRSAPALSLKTKAGQPPLKVNRRAKVANLNADLVDGVSAADLQSRALTFAVQPRSGSSTVLDVPLGAVPTGSYLASYSVVLQAVDDTVCYLRRGPSGSAYTALTYGVGFGAIAFRTHQASTVVDVDPTDELLLHCNSPAPINFRTGSDSSSVSFVRLDQVSSQTAPTPRAVR